MRFQRVEPAPEPQTLEPAQLRICPLCQRAIETRLMFAHLESEHQQWRHSTLKVVRAYHPEWREADGICPTCWKSYRAATQALRLMRRDPSPVSARKGDD
jgi:hypothetical protein